jgi:sugar/nucleoside kinase (ribokinase family)
MAGAAVNGVLVVGELCADIIVELTADPTFDDAEVVVPATTITMGSSSAITACGLARLGVDTQLVGVVGDDLLGRFVRDELADRAVGTDGVLVDGERPTGSSTILTRADGSRSILTALGTIGAIRVGDVPRALVERATHVHVGSYFLQYGLQHDLGDWFGELRAAGLSTSLDPNFDPALTWDSGITDVLRHTDVLFCNEEEGRAITRTDSTEAAIRSLCSLLPAGGLLVLKRGAAGAEVHTADGLLARAAAPEDPRPFVDAVGAGDSLAAGYLAARSRGLDPAGCLRVGVSTGTASTRAPGGVNGQVGWDPSWR